MGNSAFTANIQARAEDVIQRRMIPFSPSAAQSLSTTYSDIDGSSIDFSPRSSVSKILYEFSFYVCADAAEEPTAHFGVMVDGVFQTDGKITEDQGIHQGSFITYSKLIDSWGTTEKTLKLQGREFGTSNDTKIHETRYMDGVFTGAGEVLVEALLVITELASDYTRLDYSDPAGTVICHASESNDVSAAQSLSTSYSDITGSDKVVTPTTANSRIHYQYTFLIRSISSYEPLSHFKLLVDGVEETESNLSVMGDGGASGQHLITFAWSMNSWGTTAKTMKLQGRHYGGVFDANLFETYYMDGVSSNALVRPTLLILEAINL